MIDTVVSPMAGRRPPASALVDTRALIDAYYDQQPDSSAAEQRVSFGTSGHRGSSFKAAFNEAHIIAISEAISRYRRAQRIDGPLFLGRDTHALSEPAFQTTLEVLAAAGLEVMVDSSGRYTPTPAISHAIVTHNRSHPRQLADGIVITPSHNPPEDGGFKYNPPSGGPADTDVTRWIQDEANRLLAEGLDGIRRLPFESARNQRNVHGFDYLSAYVDRLDEVVDVEAIRSAGLRLGVDPLGGASVDYWPAIAERHRLQLAVVNQAVDPTFSFMTVDWDGKIRMDCSSSYAMAGLIGLKDGFDVAFATDPDADRHGIVTPSSGLLNPNHYLAVAISFLFGGNREWPATTAVGKTIVSSSMIDRVAGSLDRRLVEVPVGFKWFVDGLLEGSLGFGGEESAGASFLRRDSLPWSTDKDGLILCLLAAEMTARTGREPGELYRALTERLGSPVYRRVDAPATAGQKSVLQNLSPGHVTVNELAGEPITQVLTSAPGNGAAIGGLKIVTANGWFAARPSGTEDVYKIYAESFVDDDHLGRILEEARSLVSAALRAAGAAGDQG